MLPIRLEHDLYSLDPTQLYHYGLLITRASGELNILPLCLWLLGGSYRNIIQPRKIYQYNLSNEDVFPIIQKFKDEPILRCVDVIIIARTAPHLGRRYATTWDVARLSQYLEHTEKSLSSHADSGNGSYGSWLV